MMLGWATASNSVGPLAAAAMTTGNWYYLGLALVVVIVVIALIAFFRTWEEIHDEEEPDSPADLLASFEKAHAEGELNDRELDRVRRLLAAGGGNGMAIPSDAGPRTPPGRRSGLRGLRRMPIRPGSAAWGLLGYEDRGGDRGLRRSRTARLAAGPMAFAAVGGNQRLRCSRPGPRAESCPTWLPIMNMLRSPIQVVPPLSTVPRWIVTNSRKTLASPIRTDVSSPW